MLGSFVKAETAVSSHLTPTVTIQVQHTFKPTPKPTLVGIQPTAKSI
ncbi:MAG: hypothetical protein AAF614_29405 [Chloroflexota bacterium]